MRQFFNGAGQDSTTNVQSFLMTHSHFEIADLYLISTAPNYAGHYLGQTIQLTDYAAPLKYSYKGGFTVGKISRGEIESKVGLEAATLDITWTPSGDLAYDNSGNSILTMLQGVTAGCFDNGTLEVWRCIMPTPGDCDSLGACLLFSGRIGNINLDRTEAKMTVNSRLELLNEQVPLNLIEPTNILALYSVGKIPKYGPPAFTVVAGSTKQKIYADPGYIPSPGAQVNSVYVTVDAKCMPWSSPANPSFAYGTNDGSAPVDSGLTLTPGDTITIVASGSCKYKSDGSYYGPGGQTNRVTGTSNGSSGQRFPTYYTQGSQLGLVGLMGAFVDNAGAVIQPLAIGVGGTWVVPAGATKLYLGIDDDIFADNYGSFKVDVKQNMPADAFVPTSHVYDFGYIVVSSGKLAGTYRGIRYQGIEEGHHVFYLYEPMPFAPTASDQFFAYIPTTLDYSTATTYAGFPFVPAPINSAIGI